MTDERKFRRKERRALIRAAKRQDKKLRKAAIKSMREGHERYGPGSEIR